MMMLNKKPRFLKRPLFLRIRNVLFILLSILTILGLVTFSLFILEEAFQTAMFGTWPAQDAKDWYQVARGVKVMEKITTTMKIVNYGIGWIQPLAFVSYRSYAISGDYYTDSLKCKIFANCPEALLGEEIKVSFTPARVEKIIEEGITKWVGTNRKVSVISGIELLPGKRIKVEGRVEKDGSRVVVRNKEMSDEEKTEYYEE